LFYFRNFPLNLEPILTSNQNAYIGQMVGDSPNGYGKMVTKYGNIYEGEFLNGRPHGWGRKIYAFDGSCQIGWF
jgi:hypothetical protein